MREEEGGCYSLHAKMRTTILSTDLTSDMLPNIGMGYMDTSTFFHPCSWGASDYSTVEWGTKPTGSTFKGNPALGLHVSITHSPAELRPLHEVSLQHSLAVGLRNVRTNFSNLQGNWKSPVLHVNKQESSLLLSGLPWPSLSFLVLPSPPFLSLPSLLPFFNTEKQMWRSY